MSSSPRHRGKAESGGEASAFARALSPNSSWPDKDEILDVVYWGRQAVGLGLGLLWGVVPFHGLLALLLYVGLSSVLGYVYVTRFQGQDEEELGGFWELCKEGFGSGFATFVVTWIITYSSLHAVAPDAAF